MSITTFNPRTAILLVMMMITSSLRLFSFSTGDPGSMAVFTPIGAMALFGGAYFNGWLKAFAFPLVTLFISDVVLSFTVYSTFRSGLLYTGWLWTYAAFALMTLMGKLIIREARIGSILIALFTVTLIHWLVSDIGGCLQEKNVKTVLTVYLARLVTAIPFEWKFLTATAVYTAFLFSSFVWMQKRFPLLAKRTSAGVDPMRLK